MSLENTNLIIDRALQDDNFWNLLLANPSAALSGYDLTDAEKALLSSLSSSPYTSARRGLLETRKLIQTVIDSPSNRQQET